MRVESVPAIVRQAHQGDGDVSGCCDRCAGENKGKGIRKAMAKSTDFTLPPSFLVGYEHTMVR